MREALLAEIPYVRHSQYVRGEDRGRLHKTEGTARILSRNERVILSFGGFWEYGDYIFKGHSDEVAKMLEGTTMEEGRNPTPDQLPDGARFMLDNGGAGTEVWLDAGEARRVFSWAREYMIGH